MRAKKAKMTELPDRLSDLLELAVKDCQKVEKMKTRKLYVYAWHAPPLHPGGVCRVCMAGAVMDRSLGADPNHYVMPYEYGEKNSAKLRHIDLMRTGKLPVAVARGVRQKFRKIVNYYASEEDGLAPWENYLKGVEFLRSKGL